MKIPLPFIAGACAAIVLSTVAFADGRNVPARAPGDAETVQSSLSKDRETPPLLYALPELDSSDVTVLEISIVQGKHQLIRQIISIPPHAAPDAVVDVLYTYPQELIKFRRTEAATPGALRFIVTSAGRVLTDEPFGAIDAGSAGLSLDNAIGEIERVAVSGPPKARVQAEGVTKEPYCQERCDQDWYSCNEWCDPRGDSCSLCYTWYNDCLSQCPNVCTDPKSVTTHTTRTPVSYTYYGSSCRTELGRTTMWDNVSLRYRVDTWERTVNCDGSYSDRWIGSHETYVNCWTDSGRYCNYSLGPPPYPRC